LRHTIIAMSMDEDGENTSTFGGLGIIKARSATRERRKRQKDHDLLKLLIEMQKVFMKHEWTLELKNDVQKYIDRTKELIASGTLNAEEKAQAEELLTKLRKARTVINAQHEMLHRSGVKNPSTETLVAIE